jgi:glycosyltransferase involved in cell wall biosynthesis
MTEPKTDRLFISWVPHARRSNALAEALNAEAVFIWYFRKKSLPRAALRYLRSTLTTIRLLMRRKPGLLICMNQPIFLVVTAHIYSKLTGAKLVIDHHAGAFNLSIGAMTRGLLKRAVRHADLNINASPQHAPIIESWGGRAQVITTIPFNFPEVPPRRFEKPTVVFVCTFSSDEPVASVLAAAEQTPHVDFLVTGNLNYADAELVKKAPANLSFTGFLPDEDYVATLAGSIAVMVLTTRDATLQRGAYEAMSLGRPVITSDWPILREAFGGGSVFVDNSPTAIAAAVARVLEDGEELAAGMRQRLDEVRSKWKQDIQRLRANLSNKPVSDATGKLEVDPQ